MMLLLFIIAFIFCFFAFVPMRLTVLHPIATFKYFYSDTYRHFKYKMGNVCKTGDLIAYVGLFGKGKTLSAVHRVVGLYHRYNNTLVWCRERKAFVTQKIKVISNVHLSEIPYESLVSLEQIVLSATNNRAADFENDTTTVTLVLGDEFSVQLNSRNFKANINPLFLNTVLTCRHHHISIFYTAQRFAHVDALLRQVTSYVISCDKLWRWQRQNVYDAWEMENATSPSLLTPQSRTGFFVTAADYNAYDTLACVGNLKKSFDEGDMMSSEEILQLQCNSAVNMDAIEKPSRSYRKNKKRWSK